MSLVEIGHPYLIRTVEIPLRFSVPGNVNGLPCANEELAETLKESPLEKLYLKMIEPFRDRLTTFSFNEIGVFEAKSGTGVRKQSGDLVNFAYNSRYHADKGLVEELAYDRFDEIENSKTLVAVHNIADNPVVIGTFRMVEGNDLEVFDLFGMEEGFKWPHQQIFPNLTTGELGRFSLHPIFDLMRQTNDQVFKKQINRFRSEVLRRIWDWGLGKWQNDGVEMPYFILEPNVRRFVEKAGIIPKVIDKTQFSDSEYAVQIRRNYPEYWKSESNPEEQPSVYIAPWKTIPID
jgi:hypothetical protein